MARRHLTALLAAVLCVLPLAATAPTATAAPVGVLAAATAGRTLTTGPTDAKTFQRTVESLRAGDTLRLLPGTYEIGGMRPELARGTSGARITVTAADPSRLPVLRGHLILTRADYWLVNKLRLVATTKDEPALKMAGGTGWTVTNSEMSGARSTGDFANVAIDSDRETRTPPQNWSFLGNCVHDAAPRPSGSSAGYHNVYVNAEGGGRGGLIARNVLFNAPGGANIKIGAGGNASVAGPAGIRVENNTLYNANQQVLVFGNVNGISLRRNLFVRSTGGSSVNTGQYLHTLRGGAVRVSSQDNYGYLLAKRPTFVLSSPTSSYSTGRNFEGRDPRFAVGCGRFQPAEAAAKGYGRYGTAP